MKHEHFAALDLGSNSFHLVTARVVDGHLQILSRFKQPVQLGKGLTKKKRLKDDAIERGLAALAQCAQRLEGFVPEHVYVVATHTLREASNADVFMMRAAQVLPFPINIISGHEEARLIYKGVAQTSPDHGKRLVFDIGGGSTEVIAGEGFEPSILSSLSMGSVSYTERFFNQGVISEKAFSRAHVAARSELEPIAKAVRKFSAAQVIGTSGMIKAIAKWVQAADSTAQEISKAQLQQCKAQLILAKRVDNIDAAIIEPERKTILPAGTAILLALLEEFELHSITTHDAALREGVLYELTARVIEHKDVRQRTVTAMATRYRVDTEHAKLVAKTARFLLDSVKSSWKLDSKLWRQRIVWAAKLHEVGLHISSSRFHSHSGYIVEHADMPGFSDEEQLFLATTLRCSRKKVRQDKLPRFTLFERTEVCRVIAIIRLAILFNTDRQPPLLLKRVHAEKDMLLLELTQEGQANPMLIKELAQEAKQQAKLGIHLHYGESKITPAGSAT